MKQMKKRNPITLNCIDCGEDFIAYSSKALRCPACRKIEATNHIKRNAEYWRINKKVSESKRIAPKMTMQEVLKELARYNKENGTHLSYGQFVQILERGNA